MPRMTIHRAAASHAHQTECPYQQREKRRETEARIRILFYEFPTAQRQEEEKGSFDEWYVNYRCKEMLDEKGKPSKSTQKVASYAKTREADDL